MANYAKKLARDVGGAAMPEWPSPVKAQARYYDDNSAVSSLITLTDNTTQIEVGTGSQGGAFIRWIPVTETAAVSPFGSVLVTNFDHYVPPGAVRQFVVPIETSGTSSIVGVNIQNGLYRRVAIIGAGPISSTIATEY